MDGINAGVAKAGSDYRSAALFLHGSTIAINTILERTGRQDRAAYHPGLPRRLRDRPHQPAGRLQSVLPETRAAGRTRAALRGQGARAWPTARSETPLDEAETRGVRPCARTARRGSRRDPVPQLLRAIRDHEVARQGHPGTKPSAACSCRRRTSCRRSIANSSVARRWSPTPISGRTCAAISARSTSTSAGDGFDGSFLIVQSTGGLYEAQQAQDAMRAHAGIGPRGRRHRHPGAVPRARLKNAIAFDMGGTTAKAGVIYNGEALTTGAALIGGYDKALPVQIAMMDIFEVGTGGGSIARVEEGAPASRPAERGRRARPGLLWPRRRRADRDRRQPRARPARRRPFPRRRDEARRRGGRSARSMNAWRNRSA